MTGKELFGVVVRTFGLVFILVGLCCFSWALLENTQDYFIFGVVLSLVGWFFLRNAKDLVRFSYHDGEEGGTDEV